MAGDNRKLARDVLPGAALHHAGASELTARLRYGMDTVQEEAQRRKCRGSSCCSAANHITSVHALCNLQPSRPCSLPAAARGRQETKFPRDSPRSFPKRFTTLFPLRILEKVDAGGPEHCGGFQVGEERMLSCGMAHFRDLTEDIH